MANTHQHCTDVAPNPSHAIFDGPYDEIPTPAWSAPDVCDGLAARLHRAHVLASLLPAAVEAGVWAGTDPIGVVMDMLIEEIRGLCALSQRVDAIFRERGLLAPKVEASR